MLTLTSAKVMIGSTVVNDQTISRSHPMGTTTRFEAMLMDDHGRAAGYRMQMRYSLPQMMGGMMGGNLMLYDDGTHGDHMAGDGVYSYEDMDGQYGCNRMDSPMGQYSYDFSGMDDMGHTTNHLMVTVTVDR